MRLLDLVSLISLLTKALHIFYGVHVRPVCWPISHSDTTLIKPAFGSLTVATSHSASSDVDSVPLHSSYRLWHRDFQTKCKLHFQIKIILSITEQLSSYFLLSPGETLLTLSLVQKWLDTQPVGVSCAEWLLLRRQPQFAPKKLPSFLEWIYFGSPLETAVILPLNFL